MYAPQIASSGLQTENLNDIKEVFNCITSYYFAFSGESYDITVVKADD